jgi:hypothetical protein
MSQTPTSPLWSKTYRQVASDDKQSVNGARCFHSSAVARTAHQRQGNDYAWPETLDAVVHFDDDPEFVDFAVFS